MFKKMVLGGLALASWVQATNVMTWVPNYSISESKAMVAKDFGGVGMKDGLTHLALQFWQPNSSGVLSYSNNGGTPATDADVTWFKNWAKTNNVKLLLCVYNPASSSGFDWSVVQSIISNSSNRTALVNNLYAEMNRLGLDGIEIDLEGANVTSSTDRSNFMLFMNELSTKIHGAGKFLSIATFASDWHTPGTGMWSQLLSITDQVTSMGYDETGISGAAASTLNYSGQKTLASSSAKFNLGMPGWLDSWLGNTASEQVNWAVTNKTGVAIWDATLSASAWQSAGVWNSLKTIKGAAQSSSSSTTISSSGTVISSSATGTSSSATGSSSAASGSCTTWAANLFTYNGTWSGPAKVTTNGSAAWTCVSGQESFCNSYSPDNNAWAQWKSAGTCGSVITSSAAISSSAVKISSSSANTPTLNLKPMALMGLQGTEIQVQAQGMVQASLRDLNGQVVWQSQAEIHGQGSFSLGRQVQGHYILELHSGKQSQSLPLVLH